jgi:hypothetical protein
MFTETEAAEFRTLVSAAFADAGHPVVVGTDQARDVPGNRFGLWNLAVACRNAADAGERASWPGIIGAHARRMISAPDRDVF